MKQYTRYWSQGVSEAYAFGSTQLIKLTGCAIEGDQVFEHNTRKIFDAGTLSDLYVHSSANTLNGSTPIRSIKGQTSYTDGNLVVTFPSSTSGTQQDTSNTDSVTANDHWSWEIDTTAASSGSITLTELEHFWEATTGAITLCGVGGSSSYGISATGIGYLPMFGRRQSNTTEAYTRNCSAAPGTWQNLGIAVVGTAATDVAIDWRGRLNGLDGNMLVQTDETHSQTIVHDTTNTDTLAAGDNMCIEADCTTHTADGGYDTEGMYTQIDATGAADYTQVMVGGARQIVPNANPIFCGVSGAMSSSATEADMQHPVRLAATGSHLTVYFSQGTGSGTSTTQLRIGGVDANQVVSFGTTSVPGGGVDSSNTDSITASDDLSVDLSVTTGNIRVQALAMKLTEVAAGADILPRGVEETESGNVGLSRAMQSTDTGFIA